MKISLKLPQTTGLIFLFGAVVFGLGVFQTLSIPSTREEVAAVEANLVVLRQKATRLSEILSEIKTIESNLKAVQTALPDSDSVPSLLIQLEYLARQSGVEVLHLGFGESKESTPATEPTEDGKEGETREEVSGVKKISLTAIVTGSSEALQTFLRNLENTSRIVNVISFRFHPLQEEGKEDVFSSTLGTEAFYLPEIEEVLLGAPLTLDTASKEYIDLVRKVKALRVYRGSVSE